MKSARFAENDTLANKKVLELLKTASKTERGAVFYSCFCLYISFHQIIYFIGSVKGDIHFQSVGENGFGYDSIFYYSPLKKTFGEVPHRIKMQYSHRAEALGLLFTFLSKELV